MQSRFAETVYLVLPSMDCVSVVQEYLSPPLRRLHNEKHYPADGMPRHIDSSAAHYMLFRRLRVMPLTTPTGSLLLFPNQRARQKFMRQQSGLLKSFDEEE